MIVDLNEGTNVQEVLLHLVRKHNLTVVLDELAQVCFIEKEGLEQTDSVTAEQWAEAGRQITGVSIPAGQ